MKINKKAFWSKYEDMLTSLAIALIVGGFVYILLFYF